jgi:hypothetical protein
MAIVAPALAALAVVGPSGTTVDASVSTTRLHYPAQRGYAIGYTVQTGDSAEKVTIYQVPPRWPERRVTGSPIALGNPTLRGPGTLGIASSIADYAFGVCLRDRGAAVPGRLDLDLGPHERATIVQPVRLSAPPWPGARYVPTASVGFASAGHDAKPARLPLSPVRVTGRSGVHIRLAVRPRLDQDRYPGPRLAPGRAVSIRGSTQPVVRHGRIRVSALVAGGGEARHVRIGVARTDAAGRFRLDPWVPPFEGTYVVDARYRHPRAGLVADRNCDLHFTVG